jgi:hypothetical protein
MNRMIFTMIFCVIFFTASGQPPNFINRDSLNRYCDHIMQTFAEGKFREATQLFKQNSVMDSTSVNNIGITMSDQMAGVLPYYRKIVGYELITEKEVKNSLALRQYLLKFENYFLIFDFFLYNNGTGWTISNFYYKDAPGGLF